MIQVIRAKWMPKKIGGSSTQYRAIFSHTHDTKKNVYTQQF